MRTQCFFSSNLFTPPPGAEIGRSVCHSFNLLPRNLIVSETPCNRVPSLAVAEVKGQGICLGPLPAALGHLDPGGELSVGTTSPGWGLEKPSRCPGQRGLLRERKHRSSGEGTSSGASVNRPSSRGRRAQPGALGRGRGKWSEAYSHALVSQTLSFGHPQWMIAR